MRKLSQLITVLIVALLGLATAAPASAGGHLAISGSGSSYASLAVDTWSQELRPNGIVVNYNPDGSPAGQADYIAGQDDFAVSDEPFRTSADQLAGLVPQHVPFGFSYIPAVADGTALLYHLSVHGKQIRNLRLSEKTLMMIFTGQITNWDDPRITHDYGSRLPNLPIIPVIHTDLAGSTFYFSSWLAHVFPEQWNAFCDKVHPGIKPPCGPTQIYPQFGNAKGQNGSKDVATYIAASVANGAIGYDEYFYATGEFGPRIPVLRLRNPAGDYVPPTAPNVTTALTAALINEDPHSPHFLQENLDRVYTFKNPKSYPLSNYSYWIVPRTGTRLPPNFSRAKGNTLSLAIKFALCGGQIHLGQLGYAPLPPNLVAGGLLAAKSIPGHAHLPAHCS
jgi:ABC-type phosphate transport system substrate-binding protein